MPSGQPLYLQISADGTAFVSGPLLPLLPETTETDFGLVVLARHRLAQHVFAAGGQSGGQSGGPLGFTLGEAGAFGPPPATSGGFELSGGFWHGVDLEGEVVVHVLQTPPVICAPYLPLTFEVVADGGAFDVTVEFSTNAGATFAPATIVAGATQALAGTPVGRRYMAIWHADADLGDLSLADVVVRVSPVGRPERGGRIGATLVRSFKVLAVEPRAGTRDLDPQGELALTFSRPVTNDPANLAASIVLEDVVAGTSEPVDLFASGTPLGVTVRVVPRSALAPDREYRLRVLPGLRPATGQFVFDQHALVLGLSAFEAAYRTGGLDARAPRLLSSVPAHRASGVHIGQTVFLFFDEELDPASVTDRTIVVTSATGVVPAPVSLLADGRTVAVSPSLQPGRCYTVSVGRGVRDLAGNALADFAHVTFTTLTSQLTPPAPTITSPTSGAVLSDPRPVITGLAAPRYEVHLFVNGFPTGLRAVARDDGTFELTPFALPDGDVSLFAVTAWPGGSPASGPGAPVSFRIETERLPASTPPAPGATDVHEVLAGALEEPAHRYELRFSGAPGAPFVLDVETLRRSQGLFAPIELRVAPENGGGTFSVAAGRQTLGAGSNTFDASGEARVTYRANDVVKDGARLRLVNPLDQTATEPQEVVQRSPIAFVSVGASPPFAGPTRASVALRARLLRSPETAILAGSGYPVRVRAVDENGEPTDAVAIEGQPGSSGATAVTDENGNVTVTFVHQDGEAPFALVVESGASFDCPPFDRLQPTRLGESGIFVPTGGESGPGGVFLSTRNDPVNNPSVGADNTLAVSRGCPPDPPPGPPPPPARTQPINVDHGGKLEARVDIVLPGRGVHFAWTRSYKGYGLYAGPLGHRWTHGFDQRLLRQPSGDVQWVTGTARTETFRSLGGGRFATPRGFDVVLSVDAQGVGTLRDPSGGKAVFRAFGAVNAPGALAEVRDAHGNRLVLEYGVTGAVAGRLIAVVDPLGRRVDLGYDLLGRIVTVTDHLGRQVRYRYSRLGDLIAATSPAVLATTEGELLPAADQFPEGRTEVYAYTSGFADERLNHQMLLRVAPVEAAKLPPGRLEDLSVLRPLACVENTYDLDPDSPSYGSVIKQRWGGESVLPAWTGETAPLAAGGTSTFRYEDLPLPPNASLNHPARKTTIVDRAGNLVELFHNRAGQCVRVRQYTNRNVRPGEPELFEATKVYNHAGLLIAHTLPSGSTTRWIHADEDLNGDGVLTPGEDRNGDGDFDDPEDVQPEDDPRYAYRPGNGVLDRRAPWQRLQLLRVVQEPDARGDTRGGVRPRIRTFEYDPVFGRLIRHTDPRGHDPDYTPQNGGPWSPERYTSHVRLDYQQGEPTATRAALAAELGTSEADLQALLDEAGVVLGLGDLNASPADDGHRFGDPVRAEAPSVRVAPGQTLMQAVYGPAQAVVALLETSPLGQPLRAVDPEGNVTLFHYHPEADPDGDGVPEPGVTSTVTTGGWLAEVIVDAVSAPGRNAGTNPPPVAARTRLFYDRAGNPTRVIDPRGVEHRTTYNVFNEPVSSRVATAIVGSSGGPVTEPGLAPLGYEARVTYDANGRPVEVRVSNAGERDGSATQVATNPWWTRKVAYDLLDGAVLTLAEVEPIADDASITVSSPGVVVSRVVYEPNRDVRLVVKPEGNVVHYVHDERSRLAYVTDGLGTPEQATTTLLVDVNGNLERIVSPVKRNPTKAPGYAGDVTLLRYNGFDEQICTHDPEGNCGDAVMDPLGQKVRFVRHGPNEENLPRLLEVEYHYDELGRLFRTDARVFEDLTQRFEKHGAAFRTIPTIDHAPPAGEEEAVTLVELDALGRALRGVDPKGDESLAVWDGAGRLLRALGPMFSSVAGAGAVRNEVRFTYNQAGQPVSATTFERSPLGLEQAFTATAAYDAVGRLFQATDPAGHTGRLLYDSRGNVIAASDAHSQVTVPNLPGLWPPTVNGHGNVARTFYDGLSRPVASEVLLKQGGVGDGSLDDTNLDTTNASNPDGKITITQRWDRNSRLVSRSDDNGNTTGWAYDARDRVVYTLGADLSVQRTLYDPDSLVRQTIDRNGTVIDRSYDAAGRLLKVEATRRATNLEGTGQAVEGTAVQAFEYDGLHRVRLAVDQNDPLDPTDDVATSFTYDSLGRQLTERHRFRAQTSLVSTFATQGRISVGAAGIDRTITRTFDLDSNRTSTTYSSGRTLTYQIDGLDRLQAIRDSVGTIAAMEFVGGRPLASTTGRGTVSTSYSYDLKRRLTGLDHVGPAGRVAGFAYAWDRSDRRASETHLPALGVAARTESYTYDSASRITRVAFGDARPDTSWVIDGVGNWVSRTEGGQTQTVNQRQNGKYAPDLMNEVSRLATFNALGSLVKDEQHTQDPNGNRIRSGEWRRSFDVFDRLVRVERTSDGATVGRYRYDALGRRVDRWFVARGEAVGQQAFHVNDGAQEVEEVDGAGNVVADYVWGGLYLDQVVQMRRGGQEYHLHANSIWSVVAATDASGVVVERYEYASIYGVCEVRNAAGAAKAASAEIGNPWRFQGRRFDPETGFYYFRLRYLDPEAGRFVSRDPLGIWGDAGNLGNGYAFAGNDPVNRVDPWGLEGDDSAAPSVFNAQKESPFPPVGYTLVDWSTGMVWYDKRRTQGTPIEHYEATGIPLPGNWDPDGPIPTIRRSKWFEHVYRHRRGQLPPEDPELMESRLRMLQLLGFAGVAFLPELFAVMRGGQILLRASMGGMAATRGAIYLQRTAITGTYRIMVRGLTTRTKDVVGQIGELTLTGRSLSLKVDLTGTGIPAGTGVVNEAISRGLQFASSQGVRVGTIEANWGLALPTNLNAFNAARQAGKSVEDAVFATPTGRAARAHGFGELVARPIVMLDESGKAWLVHVQFRKGCP
ncbi:MAG: Ig-like domain-containing protein [Planctomycetota bacterium]|nr:Ig-like domain-containing protein [Planctomycetota bacterium]